LPPTAERVPLNHPAGLPTPRQVQVAFFALFGLLDEREAAAF